MELTYNIQGQIIHRQSQNCLANNGQEYLSLRLSFDEEWQNYDKFILFNYHKTNYLMELEYDNEAEAYLQIVPKEVMTGKGFRFTIYGTLGLERITTRQVKVDLLESGYTTDITSIDYPDTPDILSQVFTRLNTLETTMTTKTNINQVETEVKAGLNTLCNKIRQGA